MKLRTIFFLMAAALLVTGGAAIIWTVNTQMRSQALQEAGAKSRILLDRNLASHTYFTHQLKPEIFKWSEEFRDPDHFAPVWMSSTYAIREMQKYFRDLNENNYYYKECAINARSPENEADGYEREFLRKLNKDPELTSRSGIRSVEGNAFFYVLRRGEAMEETCLRCHSSPEKAPEEMVAEYGPERSFDRYPGEVVSAISIRIPLKEAFANANRISIYLSGIMVLILAGFFAAILGFTRKFLFSPIDRLREKAGQIAESESRLGETIDLPRGSELRGLTESFNAMSIKLGSQMEELEDRVRARTGELSEKNRQLEKAVAEQERTAYLLEQSERKYRSMMESMPDPVYICDPDYTVGYMNPAMIRRTGRDASGEPCHMAVHGLEEKCPWCTFETVKNGEYASREIISPLDGKTFNITHAPVKNRDGSVSKLSIYRDVTEMREMENQLFSARKFEAVAMMAAGISHDFNNLMAVILGCISMVDTDSLPENDRELLKNAENSCIQAKDLTRRLMILTRSREPEMASSDLVPVIKRAAEKVFSYTPAINTQFDLPESGAAAVFDEEQMELVFSEIMKNAKEAMPEGGSLAVSVEADGQVKIVFKDTGRAIARHDAEKIFDPYFTTKEMGAVKGMGLGLSTAYAIIVKHGGRINVDSDPGKGTRVTVELPAENR